MLVRYDIDLHDDIFPSLTHHYQLCVTPDYIYIPTAKDPDAVKKFVAAFKKAVNECWPDGSLTSSDFSHIINQNHFKRVESIINKTKGKVVVGGGKDEQTLKMEITMVVDIEKDDSVLEGENFGPLIPIVEVKTIEDAVRQIGERSVRFSLLEFTTSLNLNYRDHPLVLYAFTNNEETKQYSERVRASHLHCRSYTIGI